MRTALHLPLSAASVGLLALVNGVALALVTAGDAGPALWMYGLLAVAAGVHAVVWEPEGLVAALLLSLGPLGALALGDRMGWMAGPLAALLLLAAELNAASWEFRGRGPFADVVRRRLASALRLAAGGAVVAVVVVVAAGVGPSLGGTLSVLVAAAAVAGLGWVVFGGAGE